MSDQDLTQSNNQDQTLSLKEQKEQDDSDVLFNCLSLIKKKSKDKEKFCLTDFEKILQVGEGTYGKVYKVKKKTELNCLTMRGLTERYLIKEKNEFFALKKLIYGDEEKNGFPITAIREISILQELEHKNIVKLIDIISSKACSQNKKVNVYLVLEYLEHDLSGVLDQKLKFTENAIKGIFYQILEGVDYMHRVKGILHRDIKASNILINSQGEVKIADFGLARHFSVKDFRLKKNYTYKVVTLWYRAPELFLGETFYREGVDIWSLGILFWQLHLGYAPIRSADDAEHFDKILETLGGINENDWPEVKGLKKYYMLKEKKVIGSKFAELTAE